MRLAVGAMRTVLVLAQLLGATWASSLNHTCKAYPGTTEWPSLASWQQLNTTLHGQLLIPTPPGAVCHPDQPSYDADRCPEVQKQWTVWDFHTDNPVSITWEQFANDTCLPDPEAPCSAGGYPSFVINATTPAHVKTGVDFARENNIRLIVKNTGHDFLGRSNAPGALSIWTHHLKDFIYYADNFALTGSGTIIPGSAVTIGSGSQMYDLYLATDAYNQTLVGGGGKTVGIGGYITGGGHSSLAPRYGLGSDSVLEMEVVTPAGEILTVNEDLHPDLFWALRGGGGSTFGVITSLTISTHPTPKIQATTFIIAASPEFPEILDLVSYVLSQFPSLTDSGLSGYHTLSKRMSNPDPSIPLGEVAGVSGYGFVQDPDSPDAIEELFKPLIETINQRWPGEVSFSQNITNFDSFLEWYEIHFDATTPVGVNAIGVSRLLDEQVLTSDSEAFKHALDGSMETSGFVQAFMVAGKGVQEATPRGGSSAVNPGWRSSYVHALTLQVFPPFDEAVEAKLIKDFDEAWQPLRELTPDLGAYLNEALPFEKDWQKAFWGTNYERLLEIKRTIDPTDVFWCMPCVGMEGWEESDNGQLCRIE